MPFTAGETIECARHASRAAMFDMWISSTGNGMALIASGSDTPCCVSPGRVQQVTEFSPAEQAKLREKFKPVVEKHGAAIGETVKALEAELAKLRK